MMQASSLSSDSSQSPLVPPLPSHRPDKIVVLGAGSWGLTISFIAGRVAAGQPSQTVVLWDRTPAKLAAMREANGLVTHPYHLQLPPSVQFESNLAKAVADASCVVFVVTAKATRSVAEAIAATGSLPADAILVNASKGIEYPSLKPMSDVLGGIFPSHRVAVLSGPTLAKEIADGKPTACTVAADSLETAEWIQQRLSCPSLLRIYSGTDRRGVELAGALKNVFAIASGYMVSRDMGENARAALLTRGLAEMSRFCLRMGAEESTLYGLSGLGDLLATCNSPLSRNYQVGYRLGKGETLEYILESMGQVAEGVHTAQAVVELSRQFGIDMPIANLVQQVIEKRVIDEQQMIALLMSRKLKKEVES